MIHAPQSVAAYNNMASALNQLGRAAEALAACDRALAQGLGDGSLHLHRAAALELDPQHERARTYARVLAPDESR